MNALLSLALLLPAAPPLVQVSDNQRFLVTADGQPFFWLADTAWELFHRINFAEAEHYLKTRAAQGYTVIQAVAVAEFDGLKEPNANGHTPFADNDPAKPNDAYFAHIDRVIARANELGLTVGLLPTWGDKVGPKSWGMGPEVFTVANARSYGEYLGKRYRDAGIVWILGGDRPPEPAKYADIWKSLAAGVRAGAGGKHIMTFHPMGGRSSAEWFHNESWLSFNMQQNGHNADVPCWEKVTREYQRTPIKPVLDGEPLYEDHPIAFKAAERGFSEAADVRKFAYWEVFAGACGHTYGNHCVWQFNSPMRPAVNGAKYTWQEAIQRPGGPQMQHLRRLIESRPFLTRIPDQGVLASPAWGAANRLQATRDSSGSYAFVYAPSGQSFRVNLAKLSGEQVLAWWYDPRTGAAKEIGKFAKQGTKEFTPPEPGENRDWVLVLDDAAKGFAAPGLARR